MLKFHGRLSHSHLRGPDTEAVRGCHCNLIQTDHRWRDGCGISMTYLTRKGKVLEQAGSVGKRMSEIKKKTKKKHALRDFICLGTKMNQ